MYIVVGIWGQGWDGVDSFGLGFRMGFKDGVYYFYVVLYL